MSAYSPGSASTCHMNREGGGHNLRKDGVSRRAESWPSRSEHWRQSRAGEKASPVPSGIFMASMVMLSSLNVRTSHSIGGFQFIKTACNVAGLFLSHIRDCCLLLLNLHFSRVTLFCLGHTRLQGPVALSKLPPCRSVPTSCGEPFRLSLNFFGALFVFPSFRL